MPRKTYKKRTYKKRTYKARRYKRRYYKRRYYRKPLKKPEIHILKSDYTYSGDTADLKNGSFINLTPISASPSTESDNMVFSIGDKKIEGRKIRLKYLYIKGYYHLDTQGHNDTKENDLNAKLYVFRIKKNMTNTFTGWNTFLDMPVNYNNSANWTLNNIYDMLYRYDWKNDIKINVVKRVKNLYKAYDNTNNLIPFKIRIPLYDCVLTCDNSYNSDNNNWTANPYPSTNGILFSFITNLGLTETSVVNGLNYMKLKTKLYYTDY